MKIKYFVYFGMKSNTCNVKICKKNRLPNFAHLASNPPFESLFSGV